MKLTAQQIEDINARAHEKTIASCLESVLEYSSKKEPNFFEEMDDDKEEDKTRPKVRPEQDYAYLREVLGLTDIQIELFAAILDVNMDSHPCAARIAHKLGMTKVGMLALKPDLNVLASKRYILYNPSRIAGSTFIVPNSVVDAISENRAPSASDLSGYSIARFGRQLKGMFKCLWDSDIDFDILMSEMNILYSANPENQIVKAFNANHLEELPFYEKALLNFMFSRVICFSEFIFQWEDYCRLFVDIDECDVLRYRIEEADLELFKRGIIEHSSSDGLQHPEFIQFTDRALKEFLGDHPSSVKVIDSPDPAIRVISHKDILCKPLFFNESERKELDRLCNLLQKDNFDQVTARLEERGMRKGVACLFHGVPGTGKTASCLDLAARTGRDIYFVDIAQIKSKWVGDSEQNLNNLFNAYNRAVKTQPLAPIMLWNEADAIFGARRVVNNAVDKMENAMQNIILQQMEDMEGILIATTNLKESLDPAMDRRFLIKVAFHTPNTDVRAQIWQSMFTDISESDANALASDYEFMTGGLIENVSRKSTVDYILTGQQPTLDYLRELCVAERTGSGKSTHVGF